MGRVKRPGPEEAAQEENRGMSNDTFAVLSGMIITTILIVGLVLGLLYSRRGRR